MKYTLKREQQINSHISKVWAFFSSPHNLSVITPPGMAFKVLDNISEAAIYEGMIINYKVSPLLGIPMNWQTKIEKVIPEKQFTDTQQKGPYKYWHHYHQFITNKNGVLMIDIVTYELPLGIIGKWMHQIIVKKKLDKIFQYRNQVIDRLFNSKKEQADSIHSN